MKQVTTVCPRDCYDSCALIATLDGSGQIMSMRGDPSHPMTRGMACPRGVKDHVRLRTNRVTEPFGRVIRSQQPTSWEHALYKVTLNLGAEQNPRLLEEFANRCAEVIQGVFSL